MHATLRKLGIAVVIALVLVPLLSQAALAKVEPDVSGVVRGSDGIVIQDASIASSVLRNGVYVPVTTLTSGTNGAWSLTDKQGTYRFTFSAPSADPVTLDLVMARGGSYTLDATLPSYGSIEGSVTDAASGALISGAQVSLFRQGPGGTWPNTPEAVVTADDGTYSRASLPCGRYLAMASADGHASTYAGGPTPDTARQFVVQRGRTVTANVALTPLDANGTISGRVLLGADPQPMFGYIYFYRQNADGTWPTTYMRTVQSDIYAGGAYTSGDLPLGTYKVRFFGVHTGVQWWRNVGTMDAATPVVLDAPGEAVTDIDGWFP